MATTTGPEFARMIAGCRSTFDRSRSRLLRWLGLKGSPDGVAARLGARTRPHYKTLEERGRVVWGAVAQVNSKMFSRGPDDLPGVTVYSTDGHYDARPHDLTAIGRACFQFKGTAPTDPEFRAVADRLTDELDHTIRTPLPRRLADGRDVAIGATMFHRARLPGGVLRAGLVPLVVAPDATELNMVLPLSFWSPSLRAAWNTLQERLEATPVTTIAPQVARDAEKRPAEPRKPDWDVSAVPVQVTPAMAAACRRMARDMDLSWTPLLFVGLRNGLTTADLVQKADPETEQSFASNGVTVVVRADQLEQLRGTVVDYRSSDFASGIVIRLPGE